MLEGGRENRRARDGDGLGSQVRGRAAEAAVVDQERDGQTGQGLDGAGGTDLDAGSAVIAATW